MTTFAEKFSELDYLSKNEEQSFGTDVVADNFVDYQACLKSCEAFGTGNNIVSLIKDVLIQRSRFTLPAGAGGGSLGETKSKPAPSCSFIKSV